MDVKEAIARAKGFVPFAFDGENVTSARLEEVDFDESKDVWLITLGIARPSGIARPLVSRENKLAAVISGDAPIKRSYKVFEVSNQTGEVLRIKMRLFEE